MKISPIHSYFNFLQTKNNDSKKTTVFNEESQKNKKFELRARFNDYMLSFGARVDKGLERFYNTNKDRMPLTVKNYVESIPDKKTVSPLDSQKKAFSGLEFAQNIDEIKNLYPDEPLFERLINPEDTKARRGILQSAKEDEELLKLSDTGILKDKSNLTVYLVKKIFLEAKTIEEINKDLENDLDPDFKADFKFKNPDSPYIYGSTLKAMGIKMPAFEYQQSLRYTRDGYSDMVGDNISRARIEFWNSLTPEQRIPRAKKSVENFEKWWNSHTKNEKLDLIAEKENVLAMLKEYKKTNRSALKQQKSQNIQNPEQKQTNKSANRVKVGSGILSQDELFKIWASKNLQIFEESLSEAEKDTLHLKRMSRLAQKWKEMSAEEKTDYISRMKTGAEPARYSMIDAWNNSLELVKQLSAYLKENQIYKPADLLYSSQEFSQFQSKIMTEFWQMYPDYAQILGAKIKESNMKVETAIQRGTFEELKRQILRDKKQRISELGRLKAELNTQNQIKQEEIPAYKKEFKEAYNSHVFGKLKSIPKNFYNDMYEKILNLLPKEAVIAWTKNLRGEYIDEKDRELIIKFVKNELPEAARYNRALEAAMADTIYELSKNSDAYKLSNSDVKTVMYHFEHGENASIVSHKNNRQYNFEIINKNKKINYNRINDLYENYKKDLTKDEINKIIHLYFHLNPKNLEKPDAVNEALKIQQMLFDYIQSYGKSAFILFSDKSAYPAAVKAKFNEKFMSNMPDYLAENIVPVLLTQKDIEQEQKLKRTTYKYINRFDFTPADYMDAYSDEMTIHFKNGNIPDSDLESFVNRCCLKRKNITAIAGIAIIPRKEMAFETKLKSLAIEQALADVLYESTNNEEVYSLLFEDLADNIELFNLSKKFPTPERKYKPGSRDTDITLSAGKKINLHKIKHLYNEYLNEINQWLSESDENRQNLDYEDLLYILNPEENNFKRDMCIAQRMAKYGFKIANFTIYPNNSANN